LDEKTKEIVERLHQLARNYADAVDSYHDDKRLTAEDSMYFVAASLITRLSERVEELEKSVTDLIAYPIPQGAVERARALLSKQEG
jgi:DNA-binding ferritin-like protein